MSAILVIVAPVFVILFLGWSAARFSYLADGTARLLAQFAFKIAMPALLFRAMLTVRELPGNPWALVGLYLTTVSLLWLLATLATRALLHRPAADGAAIAMGATFSNSVMLGIPLALSAFGPDAAVPIALLITLDTPVLWIMATLHVEWATRSSGGPPLAVLGGLARDLATNPIILPILLGTAWRLLELPMPILADRILALLAEAALPSALFALGMSLAGYRLSGEARTLATISVLKLLAMPAIVWVLAAHVFELPAVWRETALLFAALPVGANAYLFAERYQRAVGSVSAAIALSTLVAVLTVPALLYLLRG
jgi:hypothetical protein